MTVPLTLVVDGLPHKVQDWSFGGFRIVDFGDQMREGEELPGSLVLPYRDSTLHIDVRFRVVWRAKIDVGCQFIELPRTARQALQHLLQDAMEGRLHDIESALEAVAEPEPTGVREEPAEEEGEAPTPAEPPKHRVKTVNPYLAAAAVVSIVSLLLLSRNLAFTDIPSGNQDPLHETVVSSASAVTAPAESPPTTVTPIHEPPNQSPPTHESPTQETAISSPLPREPILLASRDSTPPVLPEIASGSAAVQLGAFGSEDGAWQFADEVASKSPELPDGADYRLRPMDPRDPDSVIRLLVGPLPSSAAAENQCARFRELGYECLVRSAEWVEAQR